MSDRTLKGDEAGIDDARLKLLDLEQVQRVCRIYRDALRAIASGRSDHLERWSCDRGCDAVASIALLDSVGALDGRG